MWRTIAPGLAAYVVNDEPQWLATTRENLDSALDDAAQWAGGPLEEGGFGPPWSPLPIAVQAYVFPPLDPDVLGRDDPWAYEVCGVELRSSIEARRRKA